MDDVNLPWEVWAGSQASECFERAAWLLECWGLEPLTLLDAWGELVGNQPWATAWLQLSSGHSLSSSSDHSICDLIRGKTLALFRYRKREDCLHAALMRAVLALAACLSLGATLSGC